MYFKYIIFSESLMSQQGYLNHIPAKFYGHTSTGTYNVFCVKNSTHKHHKKNKQTRDVFNFQSLFFLNYSKLPPPPICVIWLLLYLRYSYRKPPKVNTRDTSRAPARALDSIWIKWKKKNVKNHRITAEEEKNAKQS